MFHTMPAGATAVPVDKVTGKRLGATNARGVGRERRGNLRGGCMSKLYVE
jgi:hypothetical protein